MDHKVLSINEKSIAKIVVGSKFEGDISDVINILKEKGFNTKVIASDGLSIYVESANHNSTGD